MRDAFGRQIDYLRLSLTSSCNLRCRYCTPAGSPEHPQTLLTPEELIRICRAAASLGICHFKFTGGEPLMRQEAADIMEAVRKLPGTESVTLTTNGLLLMPLLPRLAAVPLDGLNISLDAVSEPLYTRIAGRAGARRALAAVDAAVAAGIPTKINTVLLEENAPEWLRILDLARQLPVSVRFIERMPVGSVRAEEAMVPASVLLRLAREAYPDLHPAKMRLGNGPATYYESADLRGHLGIIAANSARFCASCNRIRLTASGQLRPCLGHAESTDLRQLLRGGAGDEELRERIAAAVRAKPAAHDFASGRNPARHMNEIGG